MKAYIRIARVDHWFKNVFMLLGAVFAWAYLPETAGWRALPLLLLGLLATCLVASSNYVLNEVLDGPRDARHPVKRLRPVPSGQVSRGVALAEWLLLAAAGLGLGSLLGAPFALAALGLWVMGLVYNVPPVRTKEWPYLDVLTESVNNPIRLLLGWFALVETRVPPLSLVLSYWMVGAFFMAAKRFAEYRHINAPAVAAEYRTSFAYYTEDRLLVSMLFYATACALFAGIFIVRYHAELILFVPIAAGLFAYYLKLTLEPDSPVQNPERLLRQPRFVVYAITSAVLFVGLLFVRIPAIYEAFNIHTASANRVGPLWTIGSPSLDRDTPPLPGPGARP